MKPFRFQKFTLQQSEKVFRVGTDGVLLGAMCSVFDAKNILEVGTGSGLISLMLAQRNSEANIEAIDLNADAVYLARENFTQSVFSKRLKVSLQDFKDFDSEKKFDIIVCNPPFFEENSSGKDVLARQQTALNFQNLIEKSAEVLSQNGILSIIIPSESAISFTALAENLHLHLVRNVNIYGIEGGVLKRNILEFSFTKKPLESLDFTIEKSPRNYSDQYLELTKEFHIFKD
jgi:tRNA1Val (adenine37-N6)-methyltransferase